MELNIAQTDPLKRSLQAIGMIVFVVLLNLGLWLILMLGGNVSFKVTFRSLRSYYSSLSRCRLELF